MTGNLHFVFIMIILMYSLLSFRTLREVTAGLKTQLLFKTNEIQYLRVSSLRLNFNLFSFYLMTVSILQSVHMDSNTQWISPLSLTLACRKK